MMRTLIASVKIPFSYLHFIINLDGIIHVFVVWSDLSNSLLKVEDINGKLGGLRTGRSEELGRILHEGLICLEYLFQLDL